MTTLRASLWVFVWALVGCDEEKKPAPPPEPAKPPPAKSSWKEIETPVPVGKQVTCANLLPPAKLETAFGKKVEVLDDTSRSPNDTAVCRLMALDKKGKASDELCMLTVGCWQQWSVADVKKKCDSRGDQTSTDIGAFTCVQTVTAGPNFRHVITVLEPDTRCRLIINAGLYVYDETATRACAKAITEIIDKDSIKL